MTTLPPCYPCMNNNKALMISIKSYCELALENDLKQYDRDHPSIIILLEMN